MTLLRESEYANPYVLVVKDGRWHTRLKSSKLRPVKSKTKKVLPPSDKFEWQHVPPPFMNWTRKAKTFARVIEVTCFVSGLSKTELKAARRFVELVYWRHVCFYVGYKHTEVSTTLMARMLGKRDHSTVLHGLEKVKNNYKDYADDIAKIEAML